MNLGIIIKNITNAAIGGFIVNIIGNRKNQRALVALLQALKIECLYNEQFRGNHIPLQCFWLEKILSNMDFHEQCPKLALECGMAFELIKDSREGNLEKRSIGEGNNKRSMVISDIQDIMKNIIALIDNIIPKIRRRTYLIWYLCWEFKKDWLGVTLLICFVFLGHYIYNNPERFSLYIDSIKQFFT